MPDDVSNLLIFYLLVFDRIHDAMCLNKMSRTSSTTSKTQQYISLYTWGTFYPRVHQTHLECLMVEMGTFIKATSLICEAQLSFAAHKKYIICFFSL